MMPFAIDELGLTRDTLQRYGVYLRLIYLRIDRFFSRLALQYSYVLN